MFEPSVENTLVAFAAKTCSAAEEGLAANSPFTAALLRRLAEPGLDVRTALDLVRREVLEETGYKQKPLVSGSLSESCFARSNPAGRTRVSAKQADGKNQVYGTRC